MAVRLYFLQGGLRPIHFTQFLAREQISLLTVTAAVSRSVEVRLGPAILSYKEKEIS